METGIERELREMSQIKKYLADDLLEAYMEFCLIYSSKYWLSFHSEFLRRMELEISII